MSDLKLELLNMENYTEDVDLFLEKWNNKQHPGNLKREKFIKTRYGEINSTGNPGDLIGWDLSWHQESYPDFIEPGIKELVFLINYKFKWITYSSCEGHFYNDLNIEPVERNISIFPENKDKFDVIAITLSKYVQKINECYFSNDIILKIYESELTDIKTNKKYPTIELVFKKNHYIEWHKYFKNIEIIYSKTLEILRKY